MKINELRRPSDLEATRSKLGAISRSKEPWKQPNWRDIIDKFFEKYGFTVSGEGYYGYVAIKDNYPYAIKVFKKDSGYLHWYQFCKKNQSNPFVPQFKGKIIKMVEDFYYVRLEKLLPIDKDDKRSKLGQLFIDTLFQADAYWIDWAQNDTVNLDEFKFTGVEHIDVIAKELLNNLNMLDIGDSNIMKRENGTPVLIDPYAGDD